jgi:peptidoglycan/xylan/chitin deacetylase (PgdA/CDA1 family)
MRNGMISQAKANLRKLLYGTGLLGLIHRLRNRDTLTVFMFHRVLPRQSAEYQAAEKEFTFSVEGFGLCLDFIQRHYQAVSQAQVSAWLDGRQHFPPCAGLITFDDGWRDTLTHALPELEKRNLPAVLFLATETIDLEAADWWQDMLVELLAQEGGLTAIKSALVLRQIAGESRSDELRRITAALGAMDEHQRQAILRPLVPRPPGVRQMLRRSDLAQLGPRITLAGHGHSHAPLSHHPRASDDLAACQAQLQAIGGDTAVLSFPHGAYDETTLQQAHAAGFSVCYSSDPVLVDTSGKRSPQAPLGRIHIPENEWTCDAKGIAPEKLATFLFFRRIE